MFNSDLNRTEPINSSHPAMGMIDAVEVTNQIASVHRRRWLREDAFVEDSIDDLGEARRIGRLLNSCHCTVLLSASRNHLRRWTEAVLIGHFNCIDHAHGGVRRIDGFSAAKVRVEHSRRLIDDTFLTYDRVPASITGHRFQLRSERADRSTRSGR